jgi:hypothetical protein
MAQTLRIGIDVDDVLAESLPAYLEAFRRRFGREVKIEEAAWEIFRRYFIQVVLADSAQSA